MAKSPPHAISRKKDFSEVRTVTTSVNKEVIKAITTTPSLNERTNAMSAATKMETRTTTLLATKLPPTATETRGIYPLKTLVIITAKPIFAIRSPFKTRTRTKSLNEETMKVTKLTKSLKKEMKKSSSPIITGVLSSA